MRTGTCRHYNGLDMNQDPECALGVNIRQLVGGGESGLFLRLPCVRGMERQQAVTVACEHREFPTPEEVAVWKEEAVKHAGQTLQVIAEIDMRHGNEEAAGEIECPRCGGTIDYTNGPRFVGGKCRTGDCIAFMS